MKPILFFLLATILFSSCDFVGGERVDGNGDEATENRQAGNFRNIAASGSIDVILQQSSDYGIQVMGDENLLPYIVTEVEGNTLKIKIKKGYNLRPKERLRVRVAAPHFEAISAGGSGNISSENTLTSDNKMVFEISGSGDIEAKIHAPALESRTNGSGDVSFSGNVKDVDMAVSGSGDIRCFGLTAETVSITINGSGDADVYASKELNLEVNGSGDIRYKGGATVNSHTNGSGSVSKAD